MIRISESWVQSYPRALVGILLMEAVANPRSHPVLEAEKGELEAHLRARYVGYDRARLKSHPVIQVYDQYYAEFNKTYHLLLQLESVALKGRSIPSVAALVECMFMAELDNLLLTAGHDMDRIKAPLIATIATGERVYVRLDGQEQSTRLGDMMITDGRGVISTVLYGPDERTRIRSETKRALFTVYAPEGITRDQVRKHMGDIERIVRLIAPRAAVRHVEVYPVADEEP